MFDVIGREIARFRQQFLQQQIQAKKNAIRKQILTLLKTQEEEDRLRKSETILARLVALPEFQASKTILFYASFDGEVETFTMMRRAQQLGKRVALPVILKNATRIIPALVNNLAQDLDVGPYGIKQPRLSDNNQLSPNDLNMVVVPGVAFDRLGHRLGRGAGYYDRFLKDLPRDVFSAGLAFDFQIVAALPQAPHDAKLSMVISN